MEAQFVPNPNDHKAAILLMGLRRGGKSSICKVVFHNMQPLDTLYLESTSKPVTEEFSSLIDLSVMELPGQLNYLAPNVDHKSLFANVGALVYVIDSQDEYLNAISNLSALAVQAVQVNPNINFEVLIHKIDGLSDDYRVDIEHDIMQRTGDELLDQGVDDLSVSFYLTSIFDHSIYEAFSRIVQKLIFELPSLEYMLDDLIQHCKIEKAFLFDVNSKIYVATDSSPVDIQTYEVCSEFIDTTVDLDGLYESTDVTNRKQELKCVSNLQNGTMLYFRQMIRGLALIGLIRIEDAGGRDQANENESLHNILTIIDHNANIFRKSLEKMWEDSRFIRKG